MEVLFVHQSFPGQFLHLAAHLSRRSDLRVRALADGARFRPHPALAGVEVLPYAPPSPPSPDTHPLAQELDAHARQGAAALAAAAHWATQGYRPDVIVAHTGWGEALFLKDLWPEAVLLAYPESWPPTGAAAVTFDPEMPLGETGPFANRSRTAGLLLTHGEVDAYLLPTRFQRDGLPPFAQAKAHVIFDGIDLERFRPNPDARLTLGPPHNRTFRPGDPVITFAARALERVRGFHVFLRALPAIQRALPDLQVLVIGDPDRTYYDPPPGPGPSLKDQLLTELDGQLDLERILFTGRLAHGDLTAAFQVTAAHVYLTYPFVLSWSMMEAMACGALVIGSATPPVEEMIRDGETGLLVPFFDRDALVGAVVRAVREPQAMLPLRDAARRHVADHYGLQDCLAAQTALIESLLAPRQGPRRRGSR